ncbi:MAG TPA: D-alanyl-D-alanine carboxypeptidase family protein [Hyphomonadaceae bacterium]|jgi:D-alanyl-D-alanine carboxypeptidase (penicillin-binding protein 5/6)
MRIIVTTLLAAALAASSALAQQPAPAPAPQAPDAAAQLAADPLNTNAPFAYIMDGDTGLPLYSKRGDEPMVPASMSKLMLYYLVFERIRDGRLKLDEELTVSEHAWRTGGAGTDGSTMFLPIHSKVTVQDLLKGAVIVSGNDACIVLAEGIAGSEEAYAREATARAKELGMTGSTFVNATGLDDPNQRMTAHDIALISYRLIKDFPQYYPMFSEPEFTFNRTRQYNRNPLLRELQGADGVKTGHLAVSGFGLVGSAVRDGKRRIIVLNGLKSETERKTEAPRIMRAAFVDFTTSKLVDKGAQVAEADVWLGAKEKVPLVATQEAMVGVHMNALKGIKAEVVYKGPLLAPVKEGDIVGDLVITVPGSKDIKIPVAAGASVQKLGLFGRAMVGLRGE